MSPLPTPAGRPGAGLAHGAPIDEPVREFKLSDVVRLIVKHAFWVVLLSILIPVAVGFWTARQRKVYEATMSVMYDFSQTHTLGKGVDLYDQYGDYMNRQQMLDTEFQLMQSMRVARQVVEDAGLVNDREFIESTFPGATPGSVSVESIANVIRSSLKLEPVRGTLVVRVSFEHSNPKVAQRLVSGYIETYVRVSTEDSIGTSSVALTWLSDQLGRLQKEVENSELAVHDFKMKRNLLSVSLNDQLSMLRDEIMSVNAAVTSAMIKRAELLARANALAKVTHSTPDEIPAQELLADGFLQGLRHNFVNARSELALLKIAGKLDSHPEVQAAQAKMDLALDAYIHQVRNIQTAALREAAVVGSELASLKSLLETAKQQAFDLNLQEIEYKRLTRATSTNERLYASVLDRLKEVDISRLVNTKIIKVLDPPALPSVPIRPRPATNIMLGLAVGFFLGVAIAVARELTDRTIKTPHDVESRFALSSLGILPDTRDRVARRPRYARRRASMQAGAEAPELLVHERPTSAIAEAARSIRSNILFMSPDSPPRTILVTSASAAEGKTTTAVTLATIFAQAGSRVLLIDLDLRRPRLHRIFKTGSQKGITTTLLGEPVTEAIKATVVDNLDVLPAGPVPPNPAELLLSEKLANLLRDVSSRYDRVIIDSPPINPITDAAILSTRVDGVLLVAWAYRTTLEQIRFATRTLRDVNGRILGVVLNAVDLNRAEYKYSYYYYSGYGGYASRTEKDAPSAAALAAVFSALLVALLFGALIPLTRMAIDDARLRGKVVAGILGGYVLRLILSQFVRELPLFSHGAGGGDSTAYQKFAWEIAQYWERTEVRYIAPEDMPGIPLIASAPLPINLYAVTMYFDGDKTLIGNVAIIAFITALTMLLLYRCAIELGADANKTLLVLGLLYFSPNYVFHTCDTYKDGVVVFLTVGAVGSAFRLSQKFSPMRLAVTAVSLWALWYVRYYLVYMAVAPICVALIGSRSKSALRPAIIAAGALALLASGGAILNKVSTEMEHTYEVATNADTREWNAEGGSGVTFDDGGNAFGALGPKLAYTIFSPFPWAGGSVGLQIAKIDGFLWYWILYRAGRAARDLWRTDKRLLSMFLVFLVPATVAYATTMSNVGLIVRQRLPLVVFTALLAALSWRRRAERATSGEEFGEQDAVVAEPAT